MATTSPDNLRTPNPGDPYNLVADLATLASDTQVALNKKVSNLLKGTTAERTAATGTATAGMLWQDTDGIKMIWRKDGAAWVPAAWSWSGTTTQMNSFAAPNGFEWFNTTDNSDYVRLGGVWLALALPPAQFSYYNSTFTITAAATTWMNHAAPAITMVAPRAMKTLISFTAFLGGNNVDYGMIGASVSGATTIGVQQVTNGGGTADFGPHTPFNASIGGHSAGFKMVTLNPGSNTIQLQARRSGAIVASASYAGLTVQPIEFA